jgi:hypothetical protein
MMLGNPYQNLNQLMKLPPELRKTWRYDTDDRHWTIVDCKTAAAAGECAHYANGFVIEIPLDTVDPERTAGDLRNAGYAFTRMASEKPGHVLFVVAAEQPCLQSRRQPHRIRRDEPAMLTVVGGDHRGNPSREVLKHTSGESWMDHLHEHTDRLQTAADNLKE